MAPKTKDPVDLVPVWLAKELHARRQAAQHWEPRTLQEWGLKKLLEEPFSGLLADPGAGKTSTTLAALKILRQQKKARRALVIAPLRVVYDVWPQEVADWKEFNELGVAVLHGPKKEQILRALRPEHSVVLVNPEGVPWLFDKAARVKQLAADVLVVDESSRWKDSATVRFRALRRHLLQFKRRHILTGSPRPRNYLDLFGQIYILDRGAALGSYVTHYRNRFFFPTGYQMREWELIPGMDKEINRLVAPMVLRLDAEDHIKLPKMPPDDVRRVVLPDDVRKEYDKVEDSLMSTLFTAPLTSSAAARSKCCQIANGAVYLDSTGEDQFNGYRKADRPVKFLHSAKVDALVELVEELQGEPLLCGIGYRHDVEAIRRALGYEVPCINGQTSRGDASEFIREWNAGNLPLLLGHPASMGHGLNLQKCDGRHVAFFDLPDDYDLYDQFYRRVRRSGNKAPFVYRHLFVVRHTVDEAKLINLRKKGSGQRAFLDAMKEYAEQRRIMEVGKKKTIITDYGVGK